MGEMPGPPRSPEPDMKFSVDSQQCEGLTSLCSMLVGKPAGTRKAVDKTLPAQSTERYRSSLKRFPLSGRYFQNPLHRRSLAAAVKRIREGPQLRELQQARQKRMFKCRKAELLREHGTLENMETSDPDTSSQSDSENHPANLPRNPYSSATRQACPSIRNYGRQVERRCCGCVQRFSKLRSVFRFLNSSDSMSRRSRARRTNAFVQFCKTNGYEAVIAADLKRERRQKAKIENWKLVTIPENFINDKRRYYREIYLKSDHWKELRSRKLQQVKCCERCGRTWFLDVHHLRYRNLYDVELCDLQVLCRRCHKKVHRRSNSSNSILSREA